MGRYKTKGDHNHPEPKESTMPEMQDADCKHEFRLTSSGFECRICGVFESLIETKQSTMPRPQCADREHEWREIDTGTRCGRCGILWISFKDPQESTTPETQEATVTEKLSVTLSFEEWKGRFRDIEVSLLEDNGGEFVEITQGDETIHVPPQAIEDLYNAMVKVT
jgi:hypothetical protein